MTRPSRLRALLLLLAAAAASCGGGGGASSTPPFITGVVVAFPGGGAPPGLEGAVVVVLDGTTGDPLQGASVTMNGTALLWSPVYQDYEGTFTVTPGAAVDLRVTVGGRTYAVTAPSFSAAPSIDVPAAGTVWASGCSNGISWSGGAPPGDGILVAVLDATDPTADPLFGFLLLPASQTTVAIPGNVLSPGSRLVFVGLTSETMIPLAVEGSSLVLVGARTAPPVTVVPADYRELAILPANRGIGSGQTQQLQAVANLCSGTGTLDLTAAATWSSSNEEVVTVSNAGGSTGLATAVAPGTATVSAVVGGIGGSAALSVRDFTPRSSPASGKLLGGVSWSGSTLVAVGESGTILTSPDGAAWTQQVSGTAAQLNGVAASPSLMVAVQYGSLAVLTSPDGVTWTPQGGGTGEGLWSVVWTGGQFVAVGIGGAIVTSPDGIVWTPRNSGTTGALVGVAASGTQIVAVGGAGTLAGVALASPDGATWTPQTIPPSWGFLWTATFTGTQFIAFGDGGPLSSPDGITWTAQTGPSGMLAMAASATEIMAVGDFGSIATSSDGRTWTTWTVGSARLTGVAWTGTRWVVVGASGTIFTSP